MDSDTSVVPLKLPPQAQVVPSLATSSGSSVSTTFFPIRAPLTVDTDTEYDNSSCSSSSISYGSDIVGPESEGYLSGEDELFETASERPFVADPDDETIQNSILVDDHVVFRPFVDDPDDETVESRSLVDDHVVFRPFVNDPDDETIENRKFVDEHVVFRPFVNDHPDGVSGAYVTDSETALERPVLADVDDVSFENGNLVDIRAGINPFVSDSYGEVDEESSSGEEDGVFMAHVADSGKEDDKYGDFGKSSVVDIGNFAIKKTEIVPIAMLSRDSSDEEESVIFEDAEDDIGLDSVKTPDDTHISETNKSGFRIKIFGDELDEEGSESEPEIGDKLVEKPEMSVNHVENTALRENDLKDRSINGHDEVEKVIVMDSDDKVDSNVKGSKFLDIDSSDMVKRENLGAETEDDLPISYNIFDPLLITLNSDLEFSKEFKSFPVNEYSNCSINDNTKQKSSKIIFQKNERSDIGDFSVVDTDEEFEGKKVSDSDFLTLDLSDEESDEFKESLSEEEKKNLENIQIMKEKFFRFLHRLGLSLEDPIASQVLYRLLLIERGFCNEPFDLQLSTKKAMELESDKGEMDLDFSFNILVIGKTGVGKSSTINSILGKEKAFVSAFEPATTSVKEIIGMVFGIKVKIFDTPGLRTTTPKEQSFNRKVLSSVKKFIRKFPPDIVLYVDRLDTGTRDLNDLALLRSITSFLGPSIWRSAIITLTHAGSNPPNDGPNGSPLSYDIYVTQRSHTIQHMISLSLGLPKLNPDLIIPVSLVENHPSFRKGENGEKLLFNGDEWRPQLLLLCFSMKFLSEAILLARNKDFFSHQRGLVSKKCSLPLPYLSYILESNSHPNFPSEQGGEGVEFNTDLGDLSNSNEDEYDQLPPFESLTKTQIANLSKDQRKAHFDEYDYRVKLLQKKHLKEEVKRMKEMKKEGNFGPKTYDHFDETILELTSRNFAKPILDGNNWDNDYEYDGVNLEANFAILNRFPAMIEAQVIKDKKVFDLHLDSFVTTKHGENVSTMLGLDIQTIGKKQEFAYIFETENKLKISKRNRIEAGLMVTFLSENSLTGFKIGDQFSIGKRMFLSGSAGAVGSHGQYASGASIGIRVKDNDYINSQDRSLVNLSMMRWQDEIVWSGNLQARVSLGRSTKMVFGAGVNSKLNGKVSVKISSSEIMQVSVLGIFMFANAIARNYLRRSRDKVQ